MSVKTVYELIVLTKVSNFAEFADEIRRYDELQNDAAQRDYGLEVTRAKNSIGKDRTFRTHGGGEVTSTVNAASVELWSYKTNGTGTVFGRRECARTVIC